MSFQKGFDELLNALLTDYINQFPEADTSQGSLLFIKSACYASALWGLYKYQEYISQQIFPDTADTENLEHHAWVRGLNRTAGETDAALLARLLEIIRRPPAGGNRYDYIRWAKEVDNVAAAFCYPLAQGDGTVDVVILANEATTGSEIPNQGLIDAVTEHIDSVRPVTVKIFRVLAPTVDATNVTMVGTGSDWNPLQAALDAEAYLNGLEPDETLYLPQLSAIAVTNGANNVTITAPAADVVPASHHMIRPGVMNVS